MKSPVGVMFETVVSQGFHEVLKPLGFKKKNTNFYSLKDGVGHMINLQKSQSSSKDYIRFTINTGIFVPEYWSVVYNWFSRRVPEYPTEPECILRTRIGELKKEDDTWYDINPDTDVQALVAEMRTNLSRYILPHFSRMLSTDMLIDFLDQLPDGVSLDEKLIVYGEFRLKDKAQKVYTELYADSARNPAFRRTLREHAEKYGLT